MRKTDKKIDNQIRKILTDVCEEQLKSNQGFQWLTHRVNYSNFPQSLKVVCVFDTQTNVNEFVNSNHQSKLEIRLQSEFIKLGIKVKNIAKHLAYDSEEACNAHNSGDWTRRLS